MLTKNGKLFFGIGGQAATSISGKSAICSTETGVPAYCATKQTNLRIYPGTGSAIPTADDYNLQYSDSSLTLVGATHIYSSAYNDNFVLQATSTWRNNTSGPVTIAELGFFVAAFQNNDSTHPLTDNFTTASYAMMIARELITPVTIEPGETYAFTMVIG